MSIHHEYINSLKSENAQLHAKIEKCMVVIDQLEREIAKLERLLRIEHKRIVLENLSLSSIPLGEMNEI